MAVGNVQHSPATLLQRLETELQPIAAKESADNRWFEVDENNHLMLRERPLDCLSIIREFLLRIFTSKLTLLEHKFESITEQVAEYLRAENDPNRLGNFLNRYTIALNELYHCAARMQQAQRISQQALNRMRALQEIQDLILTDREESITLERNGYRISPYRLLNCVHLINEIPDATAQLETSAGVLTADFCFKTADAPREIWAKVTHVAKQRFGPIPTKLCVGKKGELTSWPLRGTQAGKLCIENLSDKQVCITLTDVAGKTASIVEQLQIKRFWLEAHQTQDLSMHEIYSEKNLIYQHDCLMVESSFVTPQISFRPACKLASHQISVTPQGTLSMDIKPLKISNEWEASAFRLSATLEENVEFQVDRPYELVTLDLPGGYQDKLLFARPQKIKIPGSMLMDNLRVGLARDPVRLAFIQQNGMIAIIRCDRVIPAV